MDSMRSSLPIFKRRFTGARDLIRRHVPRSVRRGAFLDIGCGTGNGVVAALTCGARCAVGIDIDFGLFSHDLDFDEFPEVCRKFGADPRRAVLIEGDLLSLRFRPGTFNYCLMFDSAEHVPTPDRFIAQAYSLLARGGYFVMDTAPLFWGPSGHHLFHLFDAEQDPWPHLMPNFEERALAPGCTDWHMRGYRTLNRITADELVEACRNAGFTVIREHRNPQDPKRARLLDEQIGRFDLALEFDRRWLLEEFLLVVARKD